jgi:metallophosphoesterase superfamily enzyme
MTKDNTSRGHVFGRTRPGASGNNPIHVSHPQEQRDTKFRPLPDPAGEKPFRLDLKSIISAADYETIVSKKKLTFHFNGDMGGIKQGMDQMLVAAGMEKDFSPSADASENPAFLYITGDCVYYFGEVSNYYSQFYEPYEHYPGPIFAVPGNHDGETPAVGTAQANEPVNPTLDGFVRNFCQSKPIKMPESNDSNRTAMTQPNVYWTLLTPLVNIVGLYSNVPEGGVVKQPQITWLQNELATLDKDIPLVVTLHHPVYSADAFHSGSTHMKQLIEDAAKKTGRHPEMVVAGHVHNYQRFTKTMAGGAQVPYLVTGAGGYYHLHAMQKVNGQRMVTPVAFKDKDGDPTTLECYSADHHGFLRMEVTNQLMTGRYYEVPRSQELYSKGSQLFDYFEFDWRKRRVHTNSLNAN